MFENLDLWMIVGMVVVALGGVFAGGVKWAVKKVEKIVKASETELDDKIWAAAKDGLRDALDELADEEAEDAFIEAATAGEGVDVLPGDTPVS